MHMRDVLVTMYPQDGCSASQLKYMFPNTRVFANKVKKLHKTKMFKVKGPIIQRIYFVYVIWCTRNISSASFEI